jgi:hypothetical protein
MAVRRPGSNAGPEIYAPPDRRTQEPLNTTDPVAPLSPQTGETAQSTDRFAGNLDAIIRRIAGASIDEIDGVIRELESVREMLRNEGQRVSREVVGYTDLSRASMAAMKTIADSIKKWKDEDASR